MRSIRRFAPQDDVLIRDARAEELPAIADLTRQAYGEYATIMTPAAWSALSAAIERALASSEPVERIVAEEGGRIVGSAMLYPPAARAYGTDGYPTHWPEVRLVAVAPQARGRGIARTLMDECVRRARSRAGHPTAGSGARRSLSPESRRLSAVFFGP